MGLGGLSVWQLFLILLIFVLAIVAAPIRHHGDSAPPRGNGGNDAGDADEEQAAEADVPPHRR